MLPRPRSPPVPGPPGASIADVVRRMDELLRRFDRAGDYRAVFLRSYRMITDTVQGAVGGATFADPRWLTALDVAFAQEYFDALDGFEAGRRIPRCWRLAFELAARRRTTVLADLVLGMNAHIIHDLPVAVWKLGLGDATRAARQEDFTAVDGLLAARIDRVQRLIERRYSLVLWVLDRAAGHADEVFTGDSLRVARARAWLDGLALIDASDSASRDALMVALDEKACAAGLPWRLEAEVQPGCLSGFVRAADRRLALAWWRR